MNELVILRLGHIVPGVFWAGTTVFLAAFLEPALRRIGPPVQGMVMAAVGRVAGPALMLAGVLTVGFGFALVARTPGREFVDLFRGGWGWTMGLGAVAGVLALALGEAQRRNVRELARIGQALAGRPPAAVEAERIGVLTGRMRLVGRTNAVIVTVAVALMASARFVDAG